MQMNSVGIMNTAKAIMNKVTPQQVKGNENAVNNKGLHTDKVELSATKETNQTPETKMLSAVNKILDEDIKLEKGQSVVVKADKTHVPFLKVFAEDAYKRGAKDVHVEIAQPEIDALQKQYCKEPDFAYKQKRAEYYEKQGAKTITFDANNDPYKLSKLSAKETEEVKKTVKAEIPEHIEKKLSDAFNEKEVFHTLLNVQKGQPISISAERQHEKNVLKFVEYAYKNGSGPIEVNFTEPGDPVGKAKLKYASEDALKDVPSYVADTWQERVDRKTARLFLEGKDPEGMSDVDPKRIVMQSKAINEVVKPIRKSGPESQWNIIYAPTTMSVKKTYADISDPMKALEMAAEDAKNINRVGGLKAHAQKLMSVADKMNDYHFKEIHFYSIDPETKQPDGKTDLHVGMHDKSRFRAAAKNTDDGVEYMANTPTEEVFSSPDKTKTNGWVSTTLPLCLNGNLVEGIRMRFENGKAVEVYADKNQELWREHIKSAEGGDMLGEVALVANSPIFHTGRVFNNTLLDENAACHIAVGAGFDDCLDGAEDIKDYKERQKYMNENNINDSNIHTDFMIGGPNVVVEGVKEDGTKVTLIKDNQFQI